MDEVEAAPGVLAGYPCGYRAPCRSACAVTASWLLGPCRIRGWRTRVASPRGPCGRETANGFQAVVRRASRASTWCGQHCGREKSADSKGSVPRAPHGSREPAEGRVEYGRVADRHVWNARSSLPRAGPTVPEPNGKADSVQRVRGGAAGRPCPDLCRCADSAEGWMRSAGALTTRSPSRSPTWLRSRRRRCGRGHASLATPTACTLAADGGELAAPGARHLPKHAGCGSILWTRA